MDEPKSSKPIMFLVSVEIDPHRLNEFKMVMEEDAIGSITRENGGCLRFDVLELPEPNKFLFYEVYNNEEAVAFHRASEHYLRYAEFRDSGGVINRSIVSPVAFMLATQRHS